MDNEDCQYVQSKGRTIRRETESGTEVELAENHSARRHCPLRRLQRPEQKMGPKMLSAAECCSLGRCD